MPTNLTDVHLVAAEAVAGAEAGDLPLDGVLLDLEARERGALA